MNGIKLNEINLDELFKEAEKFFSSKEFDKSEKILKNILEKYPDHPDALSNLATICFAKNNQAESVTYLKKLLSQDPRSYVNQYRCAIALAELDQFEDAIYHCKEAIKINPEYLEAYEHLVNIYEFLGKKNEQKETYERIISFKKSYEPAYLYLSNLLLKEGKHYEAIILLNEINSFNPNLPAVHCTFGAIYYSLGRLEESKKHLHLSHKLNHLYSNTIHNLGMVYQAEGFFEKATHYFRDAVNLDNLKVNQEKNAKEKIEDDNNHLLSLAENLLRIGNYLQGWNFYDARLKLKSNFLCIYNLDPARWENIKPNSSILILKEQGIADQIYYSRYIDYFLKIASKLTICMDERLIPVFKRTYIDRKIEFINSNPGEIDIGYDYVIPFASLPKINFKNNINLNKINHKNLIVNDEIAIKKPTKSLPLVGISWRSRSATMGERSSIELEKFLEIFNDINVTIINLQYGELTKDEISSLTKFENINFLAYTEIDKFLEIDKLISLIHICDYIVTIDNITAHLAGSINKKSFILLPKLADFRWGLMNKFNPFYPSIELIRNKKNNDWKEAIVYLNKYLKKIFKNK